MEEGQVGVSATRAGEMVVKVDLVAMEDLVVMDKREKAVARGNDFLSPQLFLANIKGKGVDEECLLMGDWGVKAIPPSTSYQL